MKLLLQNRNFISFWYIPRNGIADYFKNLQAVFHGGWTHLHFYQQCTRVPFSLHPHQYLLFLVFLIRAILIDIRPPWWIQSVKNLPAMQETWVQPLGWGDPLEKGMPTHSSVLAWEIPWREEPGLATVHGVTRVGHDLATKPPPQYVWSIISLWFWFAFPWWWVTMSTFLIYWSFVCLLWKYNHFFNLENVGNFH